ncbi:ribosomal-processing cysteine protease Prp [Mobilitalea sibirica]|uniref:Ribosomal processing cysteine protease Prp n=1 Tax=Mobilitalea sibirica TaxID=1462919 RepID=A0A8J7HBD8_9FIRM|nr:ribosomal-processing cysteine protease Prp [Mobilitalea sibirica]MBH1940976.1 ribosomal-processing cysteine protease Prp [Mobilitalea sibirica]
MIQVSIYKNADNLITGFILSGHADYSEYGSDIVCSAVSALVINTINSVENFTSDRFHLEQDEKKGFIEFRVIEPMSSNTNLLLNSLALGLQGIQEEYTDQYIKLTQVKSQ